MRRLQGAVRARPRPLRAPRRGFSPRDPTAFFAAAAAATAAAAIAPYRPPADAPRFDFAGRPGFRAAAAAGNAGRGSGCRAICRRRGRRWRGRRANRASPPRPSRVKRSLRLALGGAPSRVLVHGSVRRGVLVHGELRCGARGRPRRRRRLSPSPSPCASPSRRRASWKPPSPPSPRPPSSPPSTPPWRSPFPPRMRSSIPAGGPCASGPPRRRRPPWTKARSTPRRVILLRVSHGLELLRLLRGNGGGLLLRLPLARRHRGADARLGLRIEKRGEGRGEVSGRASGRLENFDCLQGGSGHRDGGKPTPHAQPRRRLGLVHIGGLIGHGRPLAHASARHRARRVGAFARRPRKG